MLGDKITMADTLMVTVFSMGIVFATLIAIYIILKGFKVLFYKEKKDNVTKVKKEALKETTVTKEYMLNQENEELIAVLTAALAASLSRPASDISIRKITRTNQSSSIWSRAGRIEQMN